MSYFRKRLAPGEEVVHQGRFHVLQYLYAWMALLLLGWLVIGIFIWARELARLGTTEFVVTTRRIVLKEGFFNVQVEELTLDSIEGSHIDQSILGRLFGYGRLTIRGRGETHILFPTMAHPGQFRSAAEGARIASEARPVEVAPIQPAPKRKPNERTLKLGSRAARKAEKIEARERRYPHSHARPI